MSYADYFSNPHSLITASGKACGRGCGGSERQNCADTATEKGFGSCNTLGEEGALHARYKSNGILPQRTRRTRRFRFSAPSAPSAVKCRCRCCSLLLANSTQGVTASEKRNVRGAPGAMLLFPCDVG